ncbi:MAG: AraC family transcriptional regulator [Luteibacter sp.]
MPERGGDTWTPYHDVEVSFDAPRPLSEANLIDAREMAGTATGHYRATMVRPAMQYFDCDLQFSDPLRIHKVLPDSLSIVHVMAGRWCHRVDRQVLDQYTPDALSLLSLSEPAEVIDTLPADSHVRLGGLRISGAFLRRQIEEGDDTLAPLLAMQKHHLRFDRVADARAIGTLFERLYHSPYTGALKRFHQESLSLAVMVELAVHLGGAQARAGRPVRAHRDLAHEARRVLDAHLAQPPAADELARRLGVGETTLRRIFKAEFGRSMLDYLRDRRLEVGRQMLREKKWQVSQIAYHVGYSNPANFAHAYKARYGHPPGAE